ncbi:MAG: hypothetical protein IPO55_01545 [Alphaproteobacteria bacterium]|nr:hypothetical protein [Alphaproteobacteria bacterium]
MAAPSARFKDNRRSPEAPSLRSVRPPQILLSACTPPVRHEAGLHEQPIPIERKTSDDG